VTVPRNRRKFLGAVGLAACLVAAACGQKANVHLAQNGDGSGNGEFASGDGTGTSGDGTGTSGDGTGGSSVIGSNGSSGSGSGSSGSGTATGTGTGTGRSGSGSGSGTSSGSGSGTPGTSAAETQGVTDDTIVIGVHGPASGAGAPSTSFFKYKQAYFDYIGKTINGRRVVVEFADDGYNPSQAVAACKSLVQDKKVFLLVGAAGTDQIVECATYAQRAGVPYLAEGVTEAGLSTFNHFFAETMTYKAQGVLLASYIKNVAGKTKWAMIRGNTKNFEDAHSGFANAATALGLTKVDDFTVPKDADNSQMQTAAQNFCAKARASGDPKDVALYPLMAPKLFIAFANFAASQQCYPRYAGIGVTLGINVVAETVCPNGGFNGGATFFSPFRGLDAVDDDWKQYSASHPDVDDIAYAIWASAKLFAAELRAAGRNLTRSGFMKTLTSTTEGFQVDTYPKVNFSQSHFGGTAVNVLEADCGKRQYVTRQRNASSF
jgi:ABC-type branched-subunit amino acid transport system substrate-binding protein